MKLIPYVYDFVSLMFDSPDVRNYVKSIILFGSAAATGETDRQSDIDLFINTPESSVEKVEAVVRDAEKRFSLSVEKKWSLLGIDLPIKYIVADLDNYRWKEVKSEIISTGVVIYGKYEGIKEGLSHYALFNYSISGLEQKKKMEFIRAFFGYTVGRKGKKHEKKGLIAEIGGIKLNNSVLVPVEKSRDIQKKMALLKVTPEIREVWIK